MGVHGGPMGVLPGDPTGDASPRAPVRPSDPDPTTSGFGVSDGSPTHHGCHPAPASLGPRWGECPPEPWCSSLRRRGLRRVTKGDEQRMYLGWENQWGRREGRASSLASFNSFGGPQTPFWGSPCPPPAAESIPPINHGSSLAGKGMRRLSWERASVQSCKRAVVQAGKRAVCEHASRQCCKRPVLQACGCAHVQARGRASTQLCKHTNVQLCKHALVQASGLANSQARSCARRHTCNFASMRTGNSASVQAHNRVQACKPAIVQASKHMIVQVCTHPIVQACNFASMQLCELISVQACKCASVLLGPQPCPPPCV